MSPENSIIVFLGLLVVLFAVGFVIIFLGSTRNRNRNNPGSRNDAGASISANEPQVARRLGENRPNNKNMDVRGEDVGGNYSEETTRDETTRSPSEK